MGTNNPEHVDLRSSSQETLRRTQDLQVQDQLQLPYVWTTQDSVLSRDVDRWLGGDRAPTVTTGIQPNSRITTAQRSTLLEPRSVGSSGIWYLAAIVLPLFNLSGARNWRCSPSSLLNTAELFLNQMAGYCARARSRIRRITSEPMASDLFAGAMDLILVLYALGFLLISMYQASML